MAQAQSRAPLYEEKVVDFLLEKAEITDRNVTRAELEAAIEEEEGHVHGPGCGHDHDHDHAKPAKKPAAKAKAKKDDEAERSEEHTSELQSLMRISYAVFCLKKKRTRHEPKTLQHHL